MQSTKLTNQSMIPVQIWGSPVSAAGEGEYFYDQADPVSAIVDEALQDAFEIYQSDIISDP